MSKFMLWSDQIICVTFNRRSELGPVLGFSMFYNHFKCQIFHMIEFKRDINHQDFKIVYLHFVKSE